VESRFARDPTPSISSPGSLVSKLVCWADDGWNAAAEKAQTLETIRLAKKEFERRLSQ
jgi:hypothetical protein